MVDLGQEITGFNPEVQFLANRGFAVIQMNLGALQVWT